MAVVLVTGMSGTGKSTVLGELARRGHDVVDTDSGGFVEVVRCGDPPQPEPLWREDRITSLLDGHTGGHLFIAGTVANQGAFYGRLSAVVLLSAPVDVLLDRLAARTTNDFGKAPDERRRVIEDTAGIEPLLRRHATAEIDTRRPLRDVVAEIERIVADSGRST